MSEINNRKVAVIGCGFVGAASAFALMESGLYTEMVLVDANKAKAEGEALDISHGMPFSKPMQIYAGDYEDLADAAFLLRLFLHHDIRFAHAHRDCEAASDGV